MRLSYHAANILGDKLRRAQREALGAAKAAAEHTLAVESRAAEALTRAEKGAETRLAAAQAEAVKRLTAEKQRQAGKAAREALGMPTFLLAIFSRSRSGQNSQCILTVASAPQCFSPLLNGRSDFEKVWGR